MQLLSFINEFQAAEPSAMVQLHTASLGYSTAKELQPDPRARAVFSSPIAPSVLLKSITRDRRRIAISSHMDFYRWITSHRHIMLQRVDSKHTHDFHAAQEVLGSDLFFFPA